MTHASQCSREEDFHLPFANPACANNELCSPQSPSPADGLVDDHMDLGTNEADNNGAIDQSETEFLTY